MTVPSLMMALEVGEQFISSAPGSRLSSPPSDRTTTSCGFNYSASG